MTIGKHTHFGYNNYQDSGGGADGDKGTVYAIYVKGRDFKLIVADQIFEIIRVCVAIADNDTFVIRIRLQFIPQFIAANFSDIQIFAVLTGVGYLPVELHRAI